MIDPLLIRLAFVILAFTGGGFLIYFILWIVTPENPFRIQPVAGQPYQNPQQPDQGSTGSADFTSGTAHPESGFTTPPPVPQTKQRNKGSLIGGLVLITLGVLFLADELIPQVNFEDLWPVILIVIGAGLLINAVTKRDRHTN